ncbi:MAG TPA: hypothetical protein VL003_08110 [Pusillimonas sp.]|uniref:hypothetical protein n=1 Tax=Pusillimonas sp. TaxID=3040095 RepID=UPI002CBBE183|nr:hypothetical protein [Pusillimonas sp.]HUH88005.1 hypothetical protein [Pusillimonas sp.]
MTKKIIFFALLAASVCQAHAESTFSTLADALAPARVSVIEKNATLIPVSPRIPEYLLQQGVVRVGEVPVTRVVYVAPGQSEANKVTSNTFLFTCPSLAALDQQLLKQAVHAEPPRYEDVKRVWDRSGKPQEVQLAVVWGDSSTANRRVYAVRTRLDNKISSTYDVLMQLVPKPGAGKTAAPVDDDVVQVAFSQAGIVSSRLAGVDRQCATPPAFTPAWAYGPSVTPDDTQALDNGINATHGWVTADQRPLMITLGDDAAPLRALENSLLEFEILPGFIGRLATRADSSGKLAVIAITADANHLDKPQAKERKAALLGALFRGLGTPSQEHIRINRHIPGGEVYTTLDWDGAVIFEYKLTKEGQRVWWKLIFRE